MDDYLKKWLIKARNDLKVAKNEITLPPEEMVTDAICFHCQQVVEKLLKAFLIFKGKEVKKTHNLEYLLEICTEIDGDFKNLDVGDLSYYAVAARYPDDFYIPSAAEARESLGLAENIKKFIYTKLNIDDSIDLSIETGNE